jgi:hypothetical protein
MGNKDTLYKKIDAKELAEMICNHDMGTIFDIGIPEDDDFSHEFLEECNLGDWHGCYTEWGYVDNNVLIMDYYGGGRPMIFPFEDDACPEEIEGFIKQYFSMHIRRPFVYVAVHDPNW